MPHAVRPRCVLIRKDKASTKSKSDYNKSNNDDPPINSKQEKELKQKRTKKKMLLDLGEDDGCCAIC